LSEIDAKQLDLSSGRVQQTGEHLDCGGFARSVRSKKTEKLPRSHAQIHIVHCR
jgi:hypothetical protein